MVQPNGTVGRDRPRLREQVIYDTLRGAPAAKRAWTERKMIEDISAGLATVTVLVTVIIGDRDQVEHERELRKIFARFFRKRPSGSSKALATSRRWKRPMSWPKPAPPSLKGSDGA